MPIQILPLQQKDIPGVVECIQEGFADDPYHLWVFDGSKVSSPLCSQYFLPSVVECVEANQSRPLTESKPSPYPIYLPVYPAS